MTIPLQLASHYGGQEVFVWSDCLLDLGTDFLVGNILFFLTELAHSFLCSLAHSLICYLVVFTFFVICAAPGHIAVHIHNLE